MILNFKKIFFLLIFFVSFSFLNASNIKGIVKSSDGKLPEVVIFIEKIEGAKFNPPIKPVVLDQKDMTFIPHILPILVGSTVEFPNSDVIRHSVFSPSNLKKFDFGTYSSGTKKTLVFDKVGVIPLLCHVHPEMSAFIIVLETPYFSVSDQNGNYMIANLPAGKYKIKTWHEWAKPKEQNITISDKQDLILNFNLEE